MRFHGKDLATGIIFILVGGFFALSALINLPLGTAFQMGPGYFPLMLSGLLIVIGVVVALPKLAPSGDGNPFGRIPWRGLILISISPILFGLTVRGLGLAPALALVCLGASFASRRVKPAHALVLAAGLTIFCLAIFSYGLRLPIPIFGTWLRM